MAFLSRGIHSQGQRGHCVGEGNLCTALKLLDRKPRSSSV